MSAFTHVYQPGHSDPVDNIPIVGHLESNEESAAQKRHESATQVSDQLMKNRFSCRYYLPQSIPKGVIDEIVDTARFSPSGNNMQPWEKVYCISGDLKDKISKEMMEAHFTHPEAYSAQYQYYPAGPIPAPYAQRRAEFGKVLYTPLGIQHGDLQGRAKISARNYEFYGAPVAFIFTINQGLTQGSWMDLGYFLQSFSIAARARGLETVSQEAPAKYQLILRKYLPISDMEIVAVGLSMGYPDLGKVKEFSVKQPKRPVEDIIQYFGM